MGADALAAALAAALSEGLGVDDVGLQAANARTAAANTGSSFHLTIV